MAIDGYGMNKRCEQAVVQDPTAKARSLSPWYTARPLQPWHTVGPLLPGQDELKSWPRWLLIRHFVVVRKPHLLLLLCSRSVQGLRGLDAACPQWWVGLSHSACWAELVPAHTHTKSSLNNDHPAASPAVLVTSTALPFYRVPRYATMHLGSKNTVWGSYLVV